MNENEKKKYDTIQKLLNKELTNKEAVVELGISRQQIYRLTLIYKEHGEKGFIHKNRGKESEKRISENIIEELKQLYLNEYYDYNFIAFYEELTENEKYKGKYKISYSTLYNVFLNDDIISPMAHKGTIKLYNERMNNAINEKIQIEEEKLELFHSRQISFEQAHTRKSNNLFVFGEEVQINACEFVWFGDIVTYLHLAVDKATKKVLFGWFEYEEVTRGYFVLLYNIIINYGIPKRIKADNRTTFSNQDNKVETTQFGIICNMLGIELITTSVATAKSNFERENGTFKNRLVAKLRHEGITEIDDASSIKYNNKYYIPVNPDTGEITCFKKKTECKFIITYNAEYWREIENHYYQLIELEDRDSIMQKESNNKPVEKKQYIPPKDHPWRKNMMLKRRLNL